MFGAYAPGQGYYGQGPLGGTVPANFVFGNVIVAQAIAGNVKRELLPTNVSRQLTSDGIKRTLPFSG